MRFVRLYKGKLVVLKRPKYYSMYIPEHKMKLLPHKPYEVVPYAYSFIPYH